MANNDWEPFQMHVSISYDPNQSICYRWEMLHINTKILCNLILLIVTQDVVVFTSFKLINILIDQSKMPHWGREQISVDFNDKEQLWTSEEKLQYFGLKWNSKQMIGRRDRGILTQHQTMYVCAEHPFFFVFCHALRKGSDESDNSSFAVHTTNSISFCERSWSCF